MFDGDGGLCGVVGRGRCEEGEETCTHVGMDMCASHVNINRHTHTHIKNNKDKKMRVFGIMTQRRH